MNILKYILTIIIAIISVDVNAKLTYREICNMNIACENPDSVFSKLNEIQSQIGESNDSVKLVYYLHKGHAYMLKKDYLNAIKYKELTRSYAEDLNIIDGDYLHTMHSLMYCYIYVEDYISASRIAKWSIVRYGSRLYDNKLSADVYWILGVALRKLKEYDYVQDILLKGVELSDKFYRKNERNYYLSLVQLFNFYSSDLKNIEKAKEIASIILSNLDATEPKNSRTKEYFDTLRTHINDSLNKLETND